MAKAAMQAADPIRLMEDSDLDEELTGIIVIGFSIFRWAKARARGTHPGSVK